MRMRRILNPAGVSLNALQKLGFAGASNARLNAPLGEIRNRD